MMVGMSDSARSPVIREGVSKLEGKLQLGMGFLGRVASGLENNQS